MKRLKKIPLRVWLFYLLLISILFTGVTFASYRSESSGGSSTRVALFANKVDVVTVDFDINKVYPGMEDIKIPITVTNYDDNGVCEVSQRYEMSAEAFVGRIPITLTWKSVDTGETISGNSVSGSFIISDGATHDDYILVVSWPVDGSYPDADIADEIEVIRLKVICEQID